MDRQQEWTARRIDFLANVLVTAVEGGINYWASVENYRTKEGPEYTLEDARALIKDEYTGQHHDLTLEVIGAGLLKIGSRDFELNPQMRKEILLANTISDAGDIDSADADAIVQAGLLGEVRYG